MRKMTLLLIILFASCKTHMITNYKITQGKRNYYTNTFEVKNDSLYFSEVGRGNYIIPYAGVIIQEKRKSIRETVKN